MYWVPVIEAIQVTGATCKAAGLYQRLSRHRAREVAAEELAIAEYDRKNDPDNNNMATALNTPLAGPPSKATMFEAAIDALLEWCDRDTTRKSMTCRARKNLTHVHLSRLTGQVEKHYYDGQYCAGYKAATLAVQSAAGAGEKNMVPDFRRRRLDHPRLKIPAKAIDNEDHRVDWLTYQNITDWNIAAKNFLISIGMGTEDQGLICKCFVCFHFLFAGNSTNCLFVRFIADVIESKMGLIHEDDVDWFLTLDETHHEFSTVGARGGAAAGRYINPSFPRSGE